MPLFRSNRFLALLLLAMLTTVAVMAGYPERFEFSEQLIPGENYHIEVQSDQMIGGKSSVRWIDESEKQAMECQFSTQVAHPYCLLQVYFASEPNIGKDLSIFQDMLIDIDYQGPGQELRLYFRNFGATYSKLEDFDSLKYSMVDIPIAELNQPIVVKMDEIKVANWWVLERHLPRPDRYVDIDNVIAMGIELKSSVDGTVERLRINQLTLRGTYISREQLYLYIIIGWAFILVSGVMVVLIERFRDKTTAIQKLTHETFELKQSSQLDQLTEVLNRRGVLNFFSRYQQQDKYSKIYSLLLFDVDHFKQINDQYGHSDGDRVLQQLAKKLKAMIRNQDGFGRWGGEEFILLCPGTNLEQALKVAEKIRLMISEHNFELEPSKQVTVSIGISINSLSTPIEVAIERADKNLYSAKANGRNRVHY
ncbi:GGDEF domain-containing protein [Neiella marina]|nr:GGDEF domain-containing protein [Neiella marina]